MQAQYLSSEKPTVFADMVQLESIRMLVVNKHIDIMQSYRKALDMIMQILVVSVVVFKRSKVSVKTSVTLKTEGNETIS